MNAVWKLAKQAFKEENYEKALKFGKETTSYDDTNVQAWMCVAKSATELRQFEQAQLAYLETVKLEPTKPVGWKGLLDVSTELNDKAMMVRALEHLADIAKNNGKMDRYYQLFSQIAQEATSLKDYEKAIAAWLVVAEGKEGTADTIEMLQLWLNVHKLLKTTPSEKISAAQVNQNVIQYAQVMTWSKSADGVVDGLFQDVQVLLNTLVVSKRQVLVSAAFEAKQQLRSSLIETCQSLTTWFPFADKALETLLELFFVDDEKPSSEKAKVFLQLLKNVAPEHGMIKLWDGLCAWKQNDFSQALKILSEVPSECRVAEAYAALADIHLHPGPGYSPQEAMRCLESAKDSCQEAMQSFGHPPRGMKQLDIKLQVLLGRAFDGVGKWEDALAVFESCIELRGDNLTVVREFAEALLRHGEVSHAKDILEKNIAEEKYDTGLRCTAAWIAHFQSDFKKAQALLQEVLLATPNHAVALYRLGVVYLEEGGEWIKEKNRCLSHLVKAVKVNPYLPGAFRSLGEFYLLMEDPIRAEKCFAKSLSIYPADEASGVALSDLLTKSNKLEEARKLWEDVISRNGAAKWAFLRLAQDQLLRNEPECIATLHKAIRLSPNDDEVWAALGLTYSAEGKYMAGRKALEKAIALGNTSLIIRCEIARIETVVGLYDESLSRLQTIVVDHPTSIVAKRLLAELHFVLAQEFCHQGRYSGSPAHIQSGVQLMEQCLELGEPTEAMYKLLGDLCCFSFYVNADESILEKGTAAYLKALHCGEPSGRKNYDVGVSYWYQVQSQVRRQGVLSSGLYSPTNEASILQSDRILNARSYFLDALRLDPSDSKSWNALAVIEPFSLRKHFQFVRSIQVAADATAWANLSLFYIQSRASDFTQHSLTSLQTLGSASAQVWFGHGVLKQRSNKEGQESLDAFACAIDADMDLSCLMAFASTALYIGDKDMGKAIFAIRKCLERDEFNPAAYNIYGLLLLRIERFTEAREAFDRSLKLLGAMQNSEKVDKERLHHAVKVVTSNKAYSLVGMGSPDDALAIYDTISETSTLDRVGIAEAYVQKGDMDSARIQLKDLAQSTTSGVMEKYAVSCLAVLEYEMGSREESILLQENLHLCHQQDPSVVRNSLALKTLVDDAFAVPLSTLQEELLQLDEAAEFESIDLLRLSYEGAGDSENALKELLKLGNYYKAYSMTWDPLLIHLLGNPRSKIPEYRRTRRQPVVGAQGKWISHLLEHGIERSHSILMKYVRLFPQSLVGRLLLICSLIVQGISLSNDKSIQVAQRMLSSLCLTNKKVQSLQQQMALHDGNADSDLLSALLNQLKSPASDQCKVLIQLGAVYDKNGKHQASLRAWMSAFLLATTELQKIFIMLRITLVRAKIGHRDKALKVIHDLQTNTSRCRPLIDAIQTLISTSTRITPSDWLQVTFKRFLPPITDDVKRV